MSRRPLASLLVLLAVIGLGLFWLLRAVGPAESQASTPTSVAVEKEPEAPAAALQAPANEAQIETAAATPAREVVDDSAPPVDPKDARWIEGRVRFADGTPADERAEVVASVSRHGGGESNDARATVAADGSFRVAVAKDAKRLFLDLRARYDYLSEPFEVPAADAAKSAEPILLTAKLGGCIHGRLVLPANALDRRAAVVGTEIQASASSDSGDGRFRNQVNRRSKADDSLEFELGGIPEKHRLWISVHPEGMADASDDTVQIKAGLVVPLDLELTLGAHVSGRVVDEKGEPAEGVELSMNSERGMSSWGDQGGKKTGADGTFDLAGIRPGKLTVQAKKDGFASARLALGDLADGAVQDGLTIVLGRGLSISGRVQWPDGRAAGGCPIEAEYKVKILERTHVSEKEERSCTAAADGTFTITGLASESVTLTARMEARAAPDAEEEIPEEEVDAAVEAAAAHLSPELAPAKKSDGPGTQGSARLEHVMPGTTGLVLILQPDKAVRGRALDETGLPIEKFRLSAEPIDDTNPWERGQKAVHGSSSAKDGTFELTGLHDGSWDVTAEAEGHSKSAAHRVVLPTSIEPFDLVLPRVASVSGTVNDPAGAPVAKARVRAERPEEMRGMMMWSRDDSGVVTDAQGKFEIANVTPGPEKIVASAEGFADNEPAAVELQAGQSMPGLVLALRRPGRIVGEVLDDAGHPDAGRRVSSNNMSQHGSHQASTDAAGHFEIEGLTPGKYWISSQPSEKEIAAATKENGEADGATWARLQKQTTATVVEGETAHVVLGGQPRDGVRVRGTVTCAGRPVAGCSLWIYRRDGTENSTQSGASDAQGRYEITVASAGKYAFTINDEKSGTSFTDQFEVPAQATFDHDIVFPAGRIAGRVLGIDGAPAAGVSVFLQPDSRAAELSSSASYGQKETDEKGAFAFDGLKGASYRLQAGEQMWGNNTGKIGTCTRSGIVLADGAHIDGLEVRLQAAARIEGSVTGPDGQAVAGAHVMVRDDQGTEIQRWPPAVSDGSGRFSMDGLTPGKVTVTARTKKLVSSESAPLTLRTGETSQVELAVRAGTMLRVIVQEGEGKVVGASITVTDDHGRDVGGGYGFGFDSGGEAPAEPGQRIGPILPGRYKVTATNHDKVSVSQDVNVSGDEQVVTLKYGG